MCKSLAKWFCVCLFFFLLADSAVAAKRVALLVAIAKYDHLNPLYNTTRDIDAVGQELERYGFQLSKHVDLPAAALDRVIGEFTEASRGAEEAVIYYSGHGMAVVQQNGLKNVLAPSDAQISCADRSAQNVIDMDRFFQATQHIPKRVFLFDACRNDPFQNCPQGNAQRGLGFRSPEAEIVTNAESKSIEDGKGTTVRATQSAAALVAFSTDLNALASDGPRGSHSPFAEALLSMLKASPRKPFLEVLNLTSGEVAKQTAYYQVPWVVTKGGDLDMCLAGGACENVGMLDKARLANLSRSLAQYAQQLIAKHDYTSAALVALEAAGERYNFAPDFPAADDALHVLETARRAGHELAVIPSPSEAREITPYPNGGRFITYGFDNTPRVWDGETRKQIFALQGHSARVVHAIVSRDRRLIATGASDGTISLWSAANGKLLRTLEIHRQIILALAFDPSGRFLASSAGDLIGTPQRDILITDLNTGLVTTKLSTYSSDIQRVEFAPSGKYLLSQSLDPAVTVWNIASKEPLKLNGSSPRAWGARFYPSSDRILLADEKDAASVYAADSGRFLFQVGQKSSLKTSYRISPDEKFIASIDQDFVQIWSGYNGKFLRSLSIPDGKPTMIGLLLEISQNSTYILAAVDPFDDPSIIVWDIANGKRVSALKVQKNPSKAGENRIGSAKFINDGALIATVSGDRTTRIWQVESEPSLLLLESDSGKIVDVALSPDGSALVTSSENNSVSIWDINTRKLLHSLPGHNRPRKGEFSADGKRLLTVDYATISRIWDAKSGRIVAKIKDALPLLVESTISPDGTRVVTSSSDVNKSVEWSAKLWDAVSGQKIADLSGHTAPIIMISFSPDSSRIVTTGYMVRGGNGLAYTDDIVPRLWDGKSGRLIAKLEGHQNKIAKAAFSPDGKYFVTASHGEAIRVWEAHSGKLVKTLEISNAPLSIAFSSSHIGIPRVGRIDILDLVKWEPRFSVPLAQPRGSVVFSHDGSLIVIFAESGDAHIWNVVEQREISLLKVNLQLGIFKAEFSIDNKLLFTTASAITSSVRVWETTTGREVARLEAPDGMLTSPGIKLTKDGLFLAPNYPAGPNGRAILWRIPGDSMANVARLKREVARCLTPAQRQAYQMLPEPPRWCVTGVGNERTPRASWQGLWPYHTTEWKDWLDSIDKGQIVELPGRSAAKN